MEGTLHRRRPRDARPAGACGYRSSPRRGRRRRGGHHDPRRGPCRPGRGCSAGCARGTTVFGRQRGSRQRLRPGLPGVRPAPQRVVVFGEGHDVPSVIAYARALAWKTVVVASRRTVATDGPGCADEVVICDPAALRDRVAIRPDDVAIVMTHNLEHDRQVLEAILGSPPAYLGVLGPKRRTARLLESIAARSGPIPAGTLARLYGPAGLDIGAEGPDEIALSIVTEIRAVLANRQGGHLRETCGPIHDRS